MKNYTKLAFTFLLLTAFHFTGYGQERYSSTFNLGLGVGGYSGYYGYVGRTIPVLSMNYELGVAKNFTLAPSISIYTFSDNYYWGNNNTPPRNYGYRETVIPIGVKGTYYFDDLLEAGSDWDFYLAGSVGFAIVRSRWDDGYAGDKDYYHGNRSTFLDLHIGAEYHFNPRIGGFLDLSSGVSTVGLAFH
jgi:hypothetical protein